MIYKANPTYQIMSDKEASIIGPVIAKLCKAGKGTPCDIVKAAEPEDSKLHPYFTWDDAVAGFNWRKQEGRTLFNAIITVDGDGIEMPAFESVPNVRFDEGTDELVTTGRIYKTTAEVLSDPDDWELLKFEIRHSLSAIKRKVKVYEDFVTKAQARLIDETIKAFDK
jgi:hypothetical protein